ncbi:MAG: PspA-associated protein PspAB [Solirubrobacteraceae bacterium]
MGLFDVLRGKRELKAPAPDRLFAIATAYVTLETELQIKTNGAAAIVFQALDTADFQAIMAEGEEIVRGLATDAGTQVESSEDSYGYRWMVVRDPDFDDLVAGVNAVSDALTGGGYGERILCAVFAFADPAGKPLYLIYNYKRGAWYPFVPSGGPQQRDNERELKLRAQLNAELPIEAELERWFPLWGIPV